MSLILDALNKAGRERQNNEAPPGLDTVHEVREFESGQAKWLYPAIVFLLLLILGMVAFWLFHAKPEPELVAVLPVSKVNTLPPKSKSIPGLPKPVLVEKEKPSTMNKSAVNELYKKQVENAKSGVNTKNENRAPTKEIVREETASAAVNNMAKEKASEATALVSPPSPPSSSPTPTPSRDKLSDFSEIANISELPWTVINSLPSLNYSSHIYKKKQIVINKQSKKEGQRLSENIQIENVLKDGVILEYQGHKFKLHALNSWVNI